MANLIRHSSKDLTGLIYFVLNRAWYTSIRVRTFDFPRRPVRSMFKTKTAGRDAPAVEWQGKTTKVVPTIHHEEARSKQLWWLFCWLSLHVPPFMKEF